jgi:hypothetical protein
MRWGVKLAIALVLGLVPARAVGETAYEPQPVPASPQPPRDSSPPETKIDRVFLRAASRSATFWFSASEPVQGFRCRFDKGEYKPCGPPRAYKHLKPGRHSFRVFTIDVAGNGDPSPALAHFRISRARSRR